MLKGKRKNKKRRKKKNEETTLIVVRRLSLARSQVKTQDIVLIHTKTMIKNIDGVHNHRGTMEAKKPKKVPIS